MPVESRETTRVPDKMAGSRLCFGGGLERVAGWSGAEGDRTPDLMTASHALSQLSYSP